MNPSNTEPNPLRLMIINVRANWIYLVASPVLCILLGLAAIAMWPARYGYQGVLRIARMPNLSELQFNKRPPSGVRDDGWGQPVRTAELKDLLEQKYLIPGESGPDAKRLVSVTIQRADGGQLVLVTSARTPEAAKAEMEEIFEFVKSSYQPEIDRMRTALENMLKQTNSMVSSLEQVNSELDAKFSRTGAGETAAILTYQREQVRMALIERKTMLDTISSSIEFMDNAGFRFIDARAAGTKPINIKPALVLALSALFGCFLGLMIIASRWRND